MHLVCACAFKYLFFLHSSVFFRVNFPYLYCHVISISIGDYILFTELISDYVDNAVNVSTVLTDFNTITTGILEVLISSEGTLPKVQFVLLITVAVYASLYCK